MKSTLKDIVQHTHGLGNITLVKITTTAEKTEINAIAEDRSIILEARFKAPIADLLGTLGMPNLSKLDTILNIPEYAENAKVTVTRKDVDGAVVPTGVHFENAAGDFKNDYRFMTTAAIESKFKAVKFNGVKWDVEFAPSVISITRLKFQAAANKEEKLFVAKTENGALKFFFGDEASHAGNFVFDNNVSGQLSRSWAWPVDAVINVLSLPGEKTFKFSDAGAAMITVDSGIADYNYIIPAQSK
jgi:hypothetical protein